MHLSMIKIKIGSKNGTVVQLVRMPACHAGGREFESRPDRLKSPSVHIEGLFYMR